MFLVSINMDPDAVAKPLQGLAHERVAAGGNCICDVYYDPARYQIAVTSENVTVLRRHVPDGEVFRLGLRPQSFVVRKPLMLGLPIYYSSTTRSLMASTHVRLLRHSACNSRKTQAPFRSSFSTGM